MTRKPVRSPGVTLAIAIASIPVSIAGWLFAEWLGYRILVAMGALP